jgi:outer membrane protein OmpA-like peptidoglycan-associated protein
MRAHSRVLAAAASAAVIGVLQGSLCLGADVVPATPAAAVPFVVGLSTVRAVVTPEGDYESFRVVDSIDAKGYRITTSAQVPGDDGDGPIDVQVSRSVPATDQAGARRMRNYFHDDDAESFPGTVPGISAVVIEDLRKSGKAALTVLDVGEMFGVSVVRRQLSGTIARVAGAPVALPVLVNGRLVQLPVIHAKGTLSQDDEQEDYEFDFLDDPRNPIVLRSKGAGGSSGVIKISYPEPPGVQSPLQRALTANEVATVYGIYFSFARADIRKQSEPVLKEIAGILAANPTWKLRIDGHTDGVGNDAANLELSKRRAAAVKTALVARYGIDAGRLTTGGYGESSPKATNVTPEGRALNRRVELRRE